MRVDLLEVRGQGHPDDGVKALQSASFLKDADQLIGAREDWGQCPSRVFLHNVVTRPSFVIGQSEWSGRRSPRPAAIATA